MSVIIKVKNISKKFGDICAVDDISFEVSKGEVLGFLGPNGAGKSTTMKILSGFLLPSFGTAELAGYDVCKNPLEVKNSLGYLPENIPLYSEMSVADFLSFITSARKVKAKRESIERVVAQLELESVLRQRIETLSKGFKRRVGLAQALIHDPEILILDEPTDGLDPNQKFQVRNLIREISKDKCIIISTHILEEVEEVCSRAIVISKGRIVADDTPRGLIDSSDSSSLDEFFRNATLGFSE